MVGISVKYYTHEHRGCGERLSRAYALPATYGFTEPHSRRVSDGLSDGCPVAGAQPVPVDGGAHS